MPRHGVTVEVQVGISMLEAFQGTGGEITYDCLRGECGLCRARTVEADGPVDHVTCSDLPGNGTKAGRRVPACHGSPGPGSRSTAVPGRR